MLRISTLRHFSKFPSLRSTFNNLNQNGNQVPIKVAFQSAGWLFGIEGLSAQTGGFPLLIEKLNYKLTNLQNLLNTPKTRKIEIIDEMSNEICKVADLAEFVRNSHPVKSVRLEAESATLTLAHVIECLNTDRELFLSLKFELENHLDYDAVDTHVGRLFIEDFESSAVHLDGSKKEEFVEVSKQCLQAAYEFYRLATQAVRVSVPGYRKYFKNIYPQSGLYYLVDGINFSLQEQARKIGYNLFHCGCKEKQVSLQNLLQIRRKLAKLSGFENYFERTIRPMLCPGTASLREFIWGISDALKQPVNLEIDKVKSINRAFILDPLAPWNMSYYSHHLRSNFYKNELNEISRYFSLGTCIEGVAILMEALFGVIIEESDTEGTDEGLWSPEVVKLSVRRENNIIGYIYCDLLARAGKSSQDCHHTIQCAKKFQNGGLQIPVAVISMSIESKKPAFLSPPILRNLFHEFGHAMHTIFGQTKYQHVSGTRCPTDFAEFPSILMEYFSFDFNFLKRYARDFSSGEPISDKMAGRLSLMEKVHSPTRMQEQLIYSLLDMELHSMSDPSVEGTRRIFDDIVGNMSGRPLEANLSPYLRFSHFSNYGGKYYSYLLSGAIASRVYYEQFFDRNFESISGKRLYDVILRHGGSRRPGLMLNEYFGDGEFDMRKYSDILIQDISLSYKE